MTVRFDPVTVVPCNRAVGTRHVVVGAERLAVGSHDEVVSTANGVVGSNHGSMVH